LIALRCQQLQILLLPPNYQVRRPCTYIFHPQLKETARAKNQHGDEVLTLAGVFVNPDDNAKHFKILGTTGAGKSMAIRELMIWALKRGDRAVFADPSGDYRVRSQAARTPGVR
jgi:type IV secretory pathway VirB4 component